MKSAQKKPGKVETDIDWQELFDATEPKPPTFSDLMSRWFEATIALLDHPDCPSGLLGQARKVMDEYLQGGER